MIRTEEIIQRILSEKEKILDLEEYLYNILIKNYEQSDLQALEQIDTFLPRVKTRLSLRIEEEKRRGVSPKYVFSDYDDQVLILYSQTLEGEEKDIIQRVEKNRENIYEAMKELSWRQFEYLCKLLLEIYGAQDANVSRGTKEGGIDFFGVLELNDYKNRLENSIKFRILGQAKHGKNRKVIQDELDSFIKKIRDYRNGKGYGLKRLPDKFVKQPYPLIALFITNGKVTIGGKESARDDGIIVFEGDQIAEDLISSEHWFKWLDINDEFNRKKFRKYFESR